MESNGKSIDLEGQPVMQPTVPVIWGQPGTNAQHAYFQCLHQGTEWAPIDFVAVIDPAHPTSRTSPGAARRTVSRRAKR